MTPEQLLEEASRASGVPRELLASMIRTESGGDPKAVSPKGAMGLMQLMPATANHYGVTDPHDPVQNVTAGARYMADLIKQYKGNTAAALAHYNGGTSQGRLVMQGKEPTKDETRNYLIKTSSVVSPNAQASAPRPTGGGATESQQNQAPASEYDPRKIGRGILQALSNGVSEADIVESLSRNPSTAARVQGALKAGATPQQILQAAGGKYYEQFVKDKAEYDPTKGMSGTEKFLAGAGGRMMDYWTGAKQLFGAATPEEMDEKRRLDAPLMQHGAARAGALGTDVATSLLLPAGAATTAGRVALGAAGGAAQGAVEGVGTGEDRGRNALIGAAAGGAGSLAAKPIAAALEYIPAKATNVVKNVWGQPAEQELAEAAKRMGVELRPAQLGSRAAQGVEALQRKTPFAGAALEKAEAKQVEDLGSAVARAADTFTTPRIQAEGAESVVLNSVRTAADRARQAASGEFDKVAELARKTGTTTVGVDNLRGSALQARGDLQDVFQKFGLTKLRGRLDEVIQATEARPGMLLSAEGKPIVKPVSLTFDEARALRTDIGSAIKAAEKASFTGGATEQEVGALKHLFKGLETDLEQWGAKNEAVKSAWDAARAKHREEYFDIFRAPTNVRRLQKPDFDPDKLVSATLMPEHAAKAANLVKALDADGKAAAKQILIRRALDHFEANPAKAARMLDFGKAGQQIFTEAEQREIAHLQEVIRRVATGKERAGGDATTRAVLGGLGTVGGGLGLATDQPSLGGGLAAAGGIAGAAALMKTPAGRRLLMTSGQANLSPAARRAAEFATLTGGQTLAQMLRQQEEGNY